LGGQPMGARAETARPLTAAAARRTRFRTNSFAYFGLLLIPSRHQSSKTKLFGVRCAAGKAIGRVKDMNGQWIGTYSGTNTGTIVADFDHVKSRAVGLVSVYQNEISVVRRIIVSVHQNSANANRRSPRRSSDRGARSGRCNRA
jgi:hypothetical protein